MAKIRINTSQNAQGMVEFALVLPILLMLILGVFAFGHLFYVYSSVVSASREAARWGAATGQSAGVNSLPRYQNCDEIRAAAARVAPISGIAQVHSPDANTPGVQITYDSGPDTAIKGNCNTSSGPEVDLGDRIVVTVRVRYQPIVPLIPIPSFMLQANTARTIIKDMAVGVAPSAVPVRNVKLQMTANPPSAVVGQNVTITISATGTDQAPVGTIALTGDVDAGNVLASCSPLTLVSGGGYTSTATCVQKYNAETIVYLKAVYTDPTAHFDPVTITKTLMVNPAAGVDTTVDVSPDPGTSSPNEPISFTATVTPASGNKPQGQVKFHLYGSTEILCTAVINNNQGKATCPNLQLGETRLGSNFMQADYYSSDTTAFHNSVGMFVYIIMKYDTKTVITRANPNPSTPSAAVAYTVTVTPIDNGVSLTPSGTVTIAVQDSSTETCTATLVSGVGTCNINVSKVGGNIITAHYEGDQHFKPSNAPTLTQTVIDTCPTLGTMTFNSSSKVINSLQFPVKNLNGSGNVTVKEVDVTWAKAPLALLQQIRLSSNVNTDTCDPATNCLWSSGTGLAPLAPDPQIISSLNTNNAVINSGTQEIMLLAFNAAIPSNEYIIKVKFTNGCEATVKQTY